jgi:hypothetical protein
MARVVISAATWVASDTTHCRRRFLRSEHRRHACLIDNAASQQPSVPLTKRKHGTDVVMVARIRPWLNSSCNGKPQSSRRKASLTAGCMVIVDLERSSLIQPKPYLHVWSRCVVTRARLLGTSAAHQIGTAEQSASAWQRNRDPATPFRRSTVPLWQHT